MYWFGKFCDLEIFSKRELVGSVSLAGDIIKACLAISYGSRRLGREGASPDEWESRMGMAGLLPEIIRESIWIHLERTDLPATLGEAADLVDGRE